MNLYNSDTNELWASVKGTTNYTYSDGVSVTINKANAVVTTYWSSLGVETVDDYILNNYSDASYICDFYLIRRTTGERVLYRFCFDVDCYGERAGNNRDNIVLETMPNTALTPERIETVYFETKRSKCGPRT